jgi:hypothetical protein
MTIRFLALASVLVLSVACGSQPSQPPTTNQTAPAATVPSTGSGGSSAGGAGGGTAATSAANPVGDQAKPAPMMMEMTVPGGTALELTLETPVSSDQSKAEDTVRAHVTRPVVIDGMTAIPAGAQAMGTVVEASPSGRVKGRATVTISFNRVIVANTPYTIKTARIMREAEATKGEDVKKVGIGAGAGAVIGAIAGGKKGAVIGTAVGAGAGTGAVLATKGKEIGLGAGATVRTTIQEPVKINAPM